MQLVLKAIWYMNKLISVLIAVLTVVTVVIVFGQVIFRFVLEEPLVWSEEVALFCLVWITFLGASLASRNRTLIGVETLVKRLSPAWRLRVEILVQLFSVIFFLAMIVYGTKTVFIVAGQRAAATGISMAWVYASVPVGGFLMFVNSLAWMAEYKAEYKKEANNMG